jgi:molybdopterin-biosynthesis enzyme MoeA-like protein
MSWLSMVLLSLGQTIAGEIGVGDNAEAVETTLDTTSTADES